MWFWEELEKMPSIKKPCIVNPTEEERDQLLLQLQKVKNSSRVAKRERKF